MGEDVLLQITMSDERLLTVATLVRLADIIQLVCKSHHSSLLLIFKMEFKKKLG